MVTLEVMEGGYKMPIFIYEDRQEVQNKISVLPTDFMKERFKTAALNKDYLETVPGGKVLKGQISKTQYNTKGSTSDSKNGKEKKSSVGVIQHSRLKGIVHAMEQVPRNSKSFELYGGEKGLEIYRNLLSKNRSVPSVNSVKQVKPSSASSSTKPSSVNIKSDTTPDGGSVSFLKNESRKTIFINGKQLNILKENRNV